MTVRYKHEKASVAGADGALFMGAKHPILHLVPWSHSGLCHQSPRQTLRTRVSGHAVGHGWSVALRKASKAGSRSGV